MTPGEIERLLPQFEGLVFETARQIVREGVELEFDDIRQLIRIKVWRAIQSHDAAHDRRLPLRRYVFMCVMNLRKDLEKRPRRYNSSIDEIRDRHTQRPELDCTLADWFDGRYLSVDAEQIYGTIGDELLLPSTLNATERALVALRMEGRPLYEIESALGLSRSEREKLLRSVREKLGDWQPARPPTPPLPGIQPRRAPVRLPLAA